MINVGDRCTWNKHPARIIGIRTTSCVLLETETGKEVWVNGWDLKPINTRGLIWWYAARFALGLREAIP